MSPVSGPHTDPSQAVVQKETPRRPAVQGWYEQYEGGSAEAELLLFERLARELMRVQDKNKASSGAVYVARTFHAKAILGVENARRPAEGTPDVHAGSTPSPADSDYLRRELAQRLGSGDVVFDLCVQRYVDVNRTPIEDGSVEWAEDVAPAIVVATLTIPRQDIDTAEAHSAARRIEQLAFNPWHTTEEFRPLGNLNRARKVAYEASSAHRLGYRFTTEKPRRNTILSGVDPGGQRPPILFANTASHWWDGSEVYGEDQSVATSLREPDGGAGLRLEEGHLPRGPSGILLTGFNDNWWMGLSAMHSLFAREHNAVCDALRREYPGMDEDRIYHTADKIDAMVGLFAENPPEGFGFSDTAFRIFILMASRRLQSDRFLTVDFRPEVYTPLGIDWIAASVPTGPDGLVTRR